MAQRRKGRGAEAEMMAEPEESVAPVADQAMMGEEDVGPIPIKRLEVRMHRSAVYHSGLCASLS